MLANITDAVQLNGKLVNITKAVQLNNNITFTSKDQTSV
jgi:hypothetical protein